MTLLDPRKGRRIADMFCGLGNFALPVPDPAHRSWVLRAARNSCAGRAGMPLPTGWRRWSSTVWPIFSRRRRRRWRRWGVSTRCSSIHRAEGAIELVKAIGDGDKSAANRPTFPAIRRRWRVTRAVLVHQKNYRLRGAEVLSGYVPQYVSRQIHRPVRESLIVSKQFVRRRPGVLPNSRPVHIRFNLLVSRVLVRFELGFCSKME